jgi:Ca2+/Na+ antiporter
MSLTREDRSESEGEEDVEEAAPNLSGGHDFRLLRLIFKAVWEHITVPVNHIVSSTFPSLIVVGYEGGGGGEGGGAGGRRPLYSIPSASFSLAACVVGISVLAYAIIFFTNLLVAQIGVGTTTVGATLVSLGAEIPDTISSISLSRNGHHDGAMAGAIGSQVINITLGVGLPALISCWLYGGSLMIDPEELKSLWLLTGLVAAVVVGYAAVSLPLFRVLACHITRYTTIKRPGALFLLALWVAANAVFVVTNEEMRGP